MNDPRQAADRIHACSTPAKKTDALAQVATAARRALDAVTAESTKPEQAFASWDRVFAGHFPARL